MADVYVVMSSNCEAYEDYHEHVESVWSSREAAVRHIEGDLGMHQCNWATPDKPYSRDRWEIDFPEYPREEEFADDPEGWEDCHDENGKLIPYWVNREDAWVLAFPLDSTPEGS